MAKTPVHQAIKEPSAVRLERQWPPNSIRLTGPVTKTANQVASVSGNRELRYGSRSANEPERYRKVSNTSTRVTARMYGATTTACSSQSCGEKASQHTRAKR